MHSKIFYIDSIDEDSKNSQESFNEAKENAPSDSEVYDRFNKYADYVTVDDENDIDYNDTINWLSDQFPYLDIQKDSIGFYFELNKDKLISIHNKLYTEIKIEISNLLNQIDIDSVNNARLLYQISDLVDPEYGMQFMAYEDYPDSIKHFILNYGSIRAEKTIKYYFIKIYDYHC